MCHVLPVMGTTVSHQRPLEVAASYHHHLCDVHAIPLTVIGTRSSSRHRSRRRRLLR